MFPFQRTSYLHTDNNDFISIGTYLHVSLSCRVCPLLKITKLWLRIWDVGHMKYSRHMYNMKIMMTQINTRGVSLGLKCTFWDPKWPASITAAPGQVHTTPGRPSGVELWSGSWRLHHTLHQNHSGSSSIAPRWLSFMQVYCLPFAWVQQMCQAGQSLEQDKRM